MSWNNSDTIVEFTVNLSNGNWELECSSYDINTKFSEFLNIIVRNFYAHFPAKSGGERKDRALKKRVTTRIKMPCNLKQEIYLNSGRNSEVTKVDYWRYCKILTEAIKDVKHRTYNKQILKSKSSVGDFK
jgi:hypothetical protein